MIRRFINQIPHLGNKYPIYFFHHVPKTGGTSVVDALTQWFDMLGDYFDKNNIQPVPPIDIQQLSSKHCVIGHFGHHEYRLNYRYPQVLQSTLSKYRYRCFTFIREPLEMRCSLYRHQLIMNQETKQFSLAEHLESVDNYTGRILNTTIENYKQVLDKYYFVGVADDLQMSFDLLAKRIRKPRLILPIINTTKKESDQVAESLTADQIAQFKHENKLDYLIYDYAKKRQAALLKRVWFRGR